MSADFTCRNFQIKKIKKITGCLKNKNFVQIVLFKAFSLLIKPLRQRLKLQKHVTPQKGFFLFVENLRDFQRLSHMQLLAINLNRLKNKN